MAKTALMMGSTTWLTTKWTSVDLPGGFSYQSFFSVLMRCANLEELTYSPPADDIPTILLIITLPCLKSFSYTGAIAPLTILECMACPSLEDLMIVSTKGPGNDEIPCLEAFLSRSQCRLQRLHLTSHTKTYADLTPLFRSPALSKLREADIYTVFNLKDDIIRALTLEEEPATHLMLAQLNLGCCKLTSDGVLSAMLRSRVKTLKRASIQIVGSPQQFVQDRQTAYELRALGIHVSLIMRPQRGQWWWLYIPSVKVT
ncbi:hypothetical protein AX16_006311 [Volvariella volvacea WC 439]|nr:hypothetical protein AX16_006311 [Volvariella volvacea WC 439]